MEKNLTKSTCQNKWNNDRIASFPLEAICGLFLRVEARILWRRFKVLQCKNLHYVGKNSHTPCWFSSDEDLFLEYQLLPICIPVKSMDYSLHAASFLRFLHYIINMIVQWAYQLVKTKLESLFFSKTLQSCLIAKTQDRRSIDGGGMSTLLFLLFVSAW